MDRPKKELLVVFGTYQSIDVLGKAQKEGFPEFDLIIADEAHRTTGAKALGDEASAFTKVHSNLNVKGTKRLYQTATPILYGTDAKKKAEENSIIISSMDDESLYGSVFYRLGFGDAISHDILTDYKLMVLAVDETVVQKLMELHLNYEEVPVYEGVEITPFVNPNYKVTKMRFAKKRDENGKLVNDLSTIIFNSDITISNIPEKAYEYVVNGRSVIEWIIDQYQVKTDKKSGITDDPNDYSDDEKYIFNLLLRIINVSIQTVDLINSLPKFEVEE